MKLLTWNLHSKPKQNKSPSFETLDDALAYLEHLAESDLVIGCIQEAPSSGRELGKYVKNKSSRLSCVPVEAKAHLIYSHSLRLRFAQPDKTRRAVVARFETPAGNTLYVAGLHFHDRDTLKHLEARGGAFALLRANLDELMDRSLPAVVLGDFNAEPTYHEIAHPFCFYARTHLRDHVVDRDKKMTGTFRRPFFYQGPDDNRTVYYSLDEGWKTMDFVLVSDELRGRVRTEVLKEVLGKQLLTSSQKRIPKSSISDHLPVLADLHFQ